MTPGRQARADARIPGGCLNEGRYRSTSRDLQCEVTPLAGRGRTGSVSWGRDETPHQPFSGEGPARRRWQHIARNALGAVGRIRRQLTIDSRSADVARASAEARCRGR